MFIRVVLLININTNNSCITTLQQLSVCVFIEAISAKCQDTFYTPHRQSTVIINLSQYYTGLEVSQIETPFPCQPHFCLSTPPPTPHNSQPSFSHPFCPLHLRSKLSATTKNNHSDCYLENLITSDLITLNILWETPISVYTNTFDCYAFYIQINVTVVLLPFTLQMLPFHALPCWATRLLYLVARWANTFQ